jgi:hypothetical protein
MARDIKGLLTKTFGLQPSPEQRAPDAPMEPPPAPMPTQEKPKSGPQFTPAVMASVQSMVWKDGPPPGNQPIAPLGGPTAPPPDMSGTGVVGALNENAKGWGQV